MGRKGKKQKKQKYIPFPWDDPGGGGDFSLASNEYPPNGINGDLDGSSQSPSSVDSDGTLHTECYQKGPQDNTNQIGDCHGDGDDRRGRAPRWEYPYSIAAQIMFLPPEKPGKGLEAWGSHRQYMDSEGYNHPVLVLTDPDDDGYVVVQKMTSFGGNTLAEQFPDVSKTERKASYMQIDDGGREYDPDAGAFLYLSPQPEHCPWPFVDGFLRKRSYIETSVSYRCKKDILLPYHYASPSLLHKKYFLSSESYWRVIDRVLLLRVEGKGPEDGPKGGTLSAARSFTSYNLGRSRSWSSA